MSTMVLLLDHDNIPFETHPLPSLLQAWLSSASPTAEQSSFSEVHLRAYGGWFSGEAVTDARFEAAAFYQATCPSVMRVGTHMCHVSFEFADRLLEPGSAMQRVESPTITHTVASRRSPGRISAKVAAPPCAEAGCQLRAVRRWLRRGRACTREACPYEFASQFERREQKQVDVHMAVDLLRVAAKIVECDHVAIASDDADLCPAVLGAAIMRAERPASMTWLRFGNERSYLDETLDRLHVRVVLVPQGSEAA